MEGNVNCAAYKNLSGNASVTPCGGEESQQVCFISFRRSGGCCCWGMVMAPSERLDGGLHGEAQDLL